MKKTKLGAFAVLGILPISAIAIGTVAGSGALAHNSVLAGQAAKCALVLDGTNTPDALVAGSGVDTVSHVEFQYNKVASKSGNHIAIKDGGYIRNSGKVYDPVTNIGGYINGIEAITIVFEDYLTDVYSQTSYVELHVGFGGYKDEKIDITSGERISFADRFSKPRNFQLSFSYTEDAGGGDEGWWYAKNPNRALDPIDTAYPYLAVKSIVIEASMKVEHYVDYEIPYANRDDVEIVADDMNSEFDNPALGLNEKDAEKIHYQSGQEVIVRPKAGAAMALGDKDVVVTTKSGTAVPVTKMPKSADQKYDAYKFTVNEDLIVNITPSVDLRPYKDEAFIGTYTMTDYLTEAETNLVLADTGEYTYGTATGTYTYDKATNEFVMSDSNLKLQVVDGLAYLKTKSSYEVGSVDGGAIATTGTTGYISWIRYVDNNGRVGDVYKHYNDWNIIGDITHSSIEQLPNEDIVVTAETVDKDNILSGNAGVYKEVVGGKEIMHQRLRPNGTALKTVNQDGFAGTYTNATSTLVLDGFGEATLDGTTYAYTVNTAKNTVTVNGKEYDVDKTNKTFVEHYDMPDPWTVGTFNFTCGSKTLTIANGKAIMSGSHFNDATPVAYTISGTKLSFALDFYDEAPADGWDVATASGTAKFEFTISEDGTTLTSTKTISKDYTLGWGSYGTLSIIKTGDVYALENETLAITQNVTDSNYSATVVNNGAHAYQNIISIRFQGSNEDKALQLHDAKVNGAAATLKEVSFEGRFLGYDVMVNVAKGATATIEATITAAPSRTYKFKTLGFYRSTSSTAEMVMPTPEKVAITQELTASTYKSTLVNNGADFTGIVAIRFKSDAHNKEMTFKNIKVNGVAATVNERIVDGKFLGYDVMVTIKAGETINITADITGVAGTYRCQTLTPYNNSSTGHIVIA